MKKIIPLVSVSLLLSLFNLQMFSQPCLPNGITFTTQEQIDNFQINYPGCTEIEGDVSIGYVAGIADITSLDGLSEIISIGGDVTIRGNDSLTSFAGLESLTTIEGSLTIGSMAYPVWVDNYLLNSLTGLEHLTHIGGNLSILCAPILGDLTGLDSLVSIGGNFSLGGNAILSNLSGLNNLTTINGSLIIGLLAYEYWLPNPSLTSLLGLGNLGFIGGEIQIGGNESLSICEAEGICQYLINPNGDINIWDNASGCNSQQEVQNACNGVSIEEQNLEEIFTISPNPLENTSQIKYTIQYKSTVTIKIIDLTGQVKITLTDKEQQYGEQQVTLKTSGLSAGTYFCVFKTCKEVQTKKIVKL